MEISKLCDVIRIINTLQWQLWDYIMHRYILDTKDGVKYISTSHMAQSQSIRRQAIIQTNANIFNKRQCNFKIQNFSFTKMHLKIRCARWRPLVHGKMS